MVLTRRSSRLNQPKEKLSEATQEVIENEPPPAPSTTPSTLMMIDETPTASPNSTDDLEVIEDSPASPEWVQIDDDGDELEANGHGDDETAQENGVEEETEDESGSEDDEEETDEEEEDESENSDVDDEEEALDEDPPESNSVDQWEQLFAGNNLEGLKQAIVWAEIVPKNWRSAFEEHLRVGVEAFIAQLANDEKIQPQTMNAFFTDGHLGAGHFLLMLLKDMRERIKKVAHSPASKWNVFRCLKALESTIGSREFTVHQVGQYHRGKRGTRAIRGAYEELWLEFIKRKLPQKLLRAVVVYLSKSVLEIAPTPHLFAEFFFKIFQRGNIFAVLALDGIFELIVKHNFEFPDFYEYVYQQTTAAALHTEHKWRFLQNIDKFLSSSHVPDYVIAGFVKRLSRLLLWTPLDAQESVLALIKNLLIRRRSLNILVHRDVPEMLDKDPYSMDATLKESHAMESSLWEIKAIQSHWFAPVARRANFIDRPAEKTENMVRSRSFSVYLEQLFDRKYGEALASRNAHFVETQDYQDDDEENDETNVQAEMKNDSRKRSKGGKRGSKQAKLDVKIPVRSVEPTGHFFKPQSKNCDFEGFLSG